MKVFLLLLTIFPILMLTTCGIESDDGFMYGADGPVMGANRDSTSYTEPSPANLGSLMCSTCGFKYFIYLADTLSQNLLLPNATAPVTLSACQIIRQSDQAQMTIEYGLTNDPPLASLLYVSWSDLDLLSDRSRPEVYDEAYTTQLTIDRGGITTQKQVTWRLHVTGKTHLVTACEVDGEPMTLPSIKRTPLVILTFSVVEGPNYLTIFTLSLN